MAQALGTSCVGAPDPGAHSREAARRILEKDSEWSLILTFDVTIAGCVQRGEHKRLEMCIVVRLWLGTCAMYIILAYTCDSSACCLNDPNSSRESTGIFHCLRLPRGPLNTHLKPKGFINICPYLGGHAGCGVS